MAALFKCNKISGGTTIVDADPPVLDLRDVIYVPFNDPGSQAGLFDHGQKMILQSWYFRGSDPLRDHGYLGTPYALDSVGETAPEARYVYGGWLHDHFGHFTLSSLCRFWHPLFADPATTVVVHSGCELSEWFSRPWSAALFAALGLSRERLVRFDRPTRLRSVVVPGPAFQEDGFAHRTFARSLNALGAKIADGRIAPSPSNRPVFLSKERLVSGVQTLLNEAEVTTVLDRAGVEIVFPETLDLADQVALWHNHRFIASFAGSALHTGIFAPGREVTTVGYTDVLRSNYVLLDKVNGAAAQYLRPAPGQIENLGTRDGFLTANMAHDPVAIAEDLLRVLDFAQRSAASRAGVPVWPRDGFWSGADADATEAGLVNLAIGRPGRQSSVHPWTKVDPHATTSGRLSGGFGFHTEHEEEAWWEVDLGAEHPVHRVRLFNRADDAPERCDRFSITLRGGNGMISAEHRQQKPRRFGGIGGDPFTWTLREPATARFVRVSLFGKDYLHLDQVEVLGPADTGTRAARIPGKPGRSRSPRAPATAGEADRSRLAPAGDAASAADGDVSPAVGGRRRLRR